MCIMRIDWGKLEFNFDSQNQEINDEQHSWFGKILDVEKTCDTISFAPPIPPGNWGEIQDDHKIQLFPTNALTK